MSSAEYGVPGLPEQALSWQLYNVIVDRTKGCPPDSRFTEFVGPSSDHDKLYGTVYSLGVTPGTDNVYMQEQGQPAESRMRIVVGSMEQAQRIQYDADNQVLSSEQLGIEELKRYFNEMVLGRVLEPGEVVEGGRIYQVRSIPYLGFRVLRSAQRGMRSLGDRL